MKKFPLLILLVSAFFFLQCASESLPGGGPADITPPQIVFHNFENGAININPKQALVLTFSEKLSADQIEKNISLFPLEDNKIDIKYHNRNIEITPINAWDSNAVYTIILEKGISDLRGNPLREPYQFTFTSGSYMPKSAIRGKILELQEKKTAKIFLSNYYQNPDSIIMHPQYFTQSGSDGSFSFEHMPKDTFFIAAYIDEDKSNSYKKKFDLPCIPEQYYVLADTLNKTFLLQAGIDNFIVGQLMKAESISPCETTLNFSKILSTKITRENFTVNEVQPDTIILNEKTLTLYHKEIKTDSLSIRFKNLSDRLGTNLLDSTLSIPITEWKDDFFHFQSFKKHLRIYPDPKSQTITGVFHSNDTSTIELSKQLSGFYRLPTTKNKMNGTFNLDFSSFDLPERMIIDSLYSFNLSLDAPNEYGRVLASTQNKTNKQLRFVLKNNKSKYECISTSNNKITIENVKPGTYNLYYYFDKNGNKKRDYGKLNPFVSPEFLMILEKNIDIKARWDTELADPFKIDIDNK